MSAVAEKPFARPDCGTDVYNGGGGNDTLIRGFGSPDLFRFDHDDNGEADNIWCFEFGTDRTDLSNTGIDDWDDQWDLGDGIEQIDSHTVVTHASDFDTVTLDYMGPVDVLSSSESDFLF